MCFVSTPGYGTTGRPCACAHCALVYPDLRFGETTAQDEPRFLRATTVATKVWTAERTCGSSCSKVRIRTPAAFLSGICFAGSVGWKPGLGLVLPPPLLRMSVTT